MISRKNLEIFERDKWKCQLCGVDTPKELRGSTHPHAPEVDHIVPTSKGGKRTPENSRCACRRCNRYKSNRENVPQNIPDLVIDYDKINQGTSRIQQGGKNGAKVTHELYANELAKWGKKGGTIGGKLGGLATNETTNGRKANGGRIGGPAFQKLYPEHGKWLGKTHGKRGGAKVQELYPGLANHVRWHLARGIWNPNCKLCFEVI